MKQLTLFVVFMLAAVLAFSQTKRIAHRSHSGKDYTFNIFSPDNFGLPAEKKKLPKTKTKEKAKPKKDTLKTTPVKADTIIKTVPAPTTSRVVTREQVYAILFAARERCRSLGLL